MDLKIYLNCIVLTSLNMRFVFNTSDNESLDRIKNFIKQCTHELENRFLPNCSIIQQHNNKYSYKIEKFKSSDSKKEQSSSLKTEITPFTQNYLSEKMNEDRICEFHDPLQSDVEISLFSNCDDTEKILDNDHSSENFKYSKNCFQDEEPRRLRKNKHPKKIQKGQLSTKNSHSSSQNMINYRKNWIWHYSSTQNFENNQLHISELHKNKKNKLSMKKSNKYINLAQMNQQISCDLNSNLSYTSDTLIISQKTSENSLHLSAHSSNFKIRKKQKNFHEIYKKNICNFLNSHIEFYSELKLFQANNTNQEFFEILHNFLINKEKQICDEIESKESNSRGRENPILHVNVEQNNFCPFCKNDVCPTISNIFIIPTFSYTDQLKKLNMCKFKSTFWDHILKFLLSYEEKFEFYRSFDTSMLICFFVNSRKEFHSLIHNLCKKSIKLNFKMKMEIFLNLYHDFKCHNFKLKLHVVPEFLSLVFIFANRGMEFYIKKYNHIFLFFFFYLRSFNGFFDTISQNKDILNNLSRDIILYKKELLSISFFIKCFFIEPLLILLIKHEKAVYLYRFFILSLLKKEFSISQNHDSDQRQLILLQNQTWWICLLCKSMNLQQLNHFFKKLNTDDIIEADHFIINQYKTIWRDFQRNHQHLLTESLLQDKNMQYLKNLIKNDN